MIAAALVAIWIFGSLYSVGIVPSSAEGKRRADGFHIQVKAAVTCVPNFVIAFVQKAPDHSDYLMSGYNVLINVDEGATVRVRKRLIECIASSVGPWEYNESWIHAVYGKAVSRSAARVANAWPPYHSFRLNTIGRNASESGAG